MTRRYCVFVTALLLLVAACGDDSGSLDTNGGTTSTTADSSGIPGGGEGGCIVDVTGDVETSWNGSDGPRAFTTDYWYTEDELRQQFSFLGPEGETFEQVMERRGQIVTFFLFNCEGPGDQLVSLIVSADATRDDFPHGPGTYAITAGMFGGDQLGPADFSVTFAIDSEDFWEYESPGTVTISEWTGDHLVGSFSFAVVESFVDTPRHLMVSGTFELFCRTSTSC